MKLDLFQPSLESEARILLLITSFSSAKKFLEGRTKLAKLDFLLQYSEYLIRILTKHRNLPIDDITKIISLETNIESKMVRYKFGPWDPSHYAIIGRLVGKQLISYSDKGFQTTDKGINISRKIANEPVWQETIRRIKLLKKHLNLSGNALKNLIYEFVPEVTNASWGDKL